MKSIHDLIRKRLLQRCNLWDEPDRKILTLKELEREIDETVWDKRFIEYMRNRLLMGRLRYGTKANKAKTYNYAEAIQRKIEIYLETGNQEMLVDIGNYAMLEFKFPSHPKAHFTSLDDEHHAKLL